MRISGFHIEGFGVHRDWREVELPPGLVVFHGGNEAGKSTLLDFLRAVLFGFPAGASRDSRHDPLNGGRHGGRITLAEGSEGLVVERFAGRGGGLQVMRPDGSDSDTDELASWLGRADRPLYNAVFAFSLRELHSLDSLHGQGVADRIFSAGIAGAGRSAAEVGKRFDDEAQDLFKPRGTRHRVKALVAALTDVDARLAAARGEAKGYGRERELEARLRDEVESARTAQDRERRELDRFDKLMSLYREVWCPLVEAREQLSALGEAAEFPEDAEARLARALGEQRALEAAAVELAREAERLAEARDTCRVDEALAPLVPSLRKLQELLPVYRERLRARDRGREELVRAEHQLDELLRELGDGVDEARLAGFDHSLRRQEEVEQWKERLASAERERLQAQARAVAAERELAFLERRRDEARNLRDAAPASEAGELEAAERAVAALREGLQERALAESDHTRAELGLAECERGATRPPSLAVPTLAGLGALAAAAAAVAG
ncbi:MAG: AAA family ATPase, partial [Proteobacteria bacterium]|nr:AAA family ATPase [Pseudomonadota bacterium]